MARGAVTVGGGPWTGRLTRDTGAAGLVGWWTGGPRHSLLGAGRPGATAGWVAVQTCPLTYGANGRAIRCGTNLLCERCPPGRSAEERPELPGPQVPADATEERGDDHQEGDAMKPVPRVVAVREPRWLPRVFDGHRAGRSGPGGPSRWAKNSSARRVATLTIVAGVARPLGQPGGGERVTRIELALSA